MPPSAMIAPASTKNGIASSENLLTPLGDLDHHRVERHVDPQRADQRGEAERVGDRHADHHQHEEAAEQDERRPSGDVVAHPVVAGWSR